MPKKLIAIKPFAFRGRVLAVDEELEPDNDEQGMLLQSIGLASVKKRFYRNRAAQPASMAVMTATEG